MKFTTTILAASAVALFAGGASASTLPFNNDTLLGAADLGGANPDVELAALADVLEVAVDTLEFDIKYDNGDDTTENDYVVDYDSVYDQFSVDIDPATPGYFILKVGNIDPGGKLGLDPVYTHFFFENLDDLSTLAWGGDFCYSDLGSMGMFDALVAEQDCEKMLSWLTVLNADGGKLSHITTTTGDPGTVIPLPAAGWLLLGGLGGLAALRRRKKA